MDDKLLTRISKLLALGNGSSFDGEADTALQKAYALMQEHNISMAQVEGASRDKQLGVLDEQAIVGYPAKRWERLLLIAVARLFDCKTFQYSRQDQQNRICNTEYIVGREGNRTTAVLMYNWLRDKLRADAIIRGGNSSARDAYCLGCVNAIREKVAAIKASEAPTDAWGIVPVDEVAQWMKTMRPELVTCSVNGSCRDDAAYDAGKKDGANINLNRQFAQQALPCA